MELRTQERRTETTLENFTNWWSEHSPEIYSYILVKVRDEELAWDLFQDSFLKAYKNLRNNKKLSFESETKLRAWTFKVVRSAIADHFRRERLRKLILIGDLLIKGKQYQERLELPKFIKDHREELMDSLKELSILREEEQEVIVLRVLMDMPFKEIAQVLGKPLGTCLTLYRRGIAKLRDKLRKRLEKRGDVLAEASKITSGGEV